MYGNPVEEQILFTKLSCVFRLWSSDIVCDFLMESSTFRFQFTNAFHSHISHYRNRRLLNCMAQGLLGMPMVKLEWILKCRESVS